MLITGQMNEKFIYVNIVNIRGKLNFAKNKYILYIIIIYLNTLIVIYIYIYERFVTRITYEKRNFFSEFTNVVILDQY